MLRNRLLFTHQRFSISLIRLSDSMCRYYLSFINQHSNMAEFEKVILIKPQDDEFDELRMEFAQMLKNQLSKGNNGLLRTKYITFIA